jgi:hypothetical protein
MGVASVNELEDFVTCGVCFCEYDHVKRKPKFLQCAHTICYECLQVRHYLFFNFFRIFTKLQKIFKKFICHLKDIRQGNTISCPFCRKITSQDPSEAGEWILPNNSYALQMLKLINR